VDYQTDLWLIVPQFLGFTIFITSATAELVRAPFDLVEAEQELTCGYNTEYGSMKFALFFMSEYIKMIVVSAIATTLYFGGWHFPGLQTLGAIVTNAAGPMAGATVVGILSLLSFLLKVAILLFIFVWVRASWPRVRYDQLMNIGWKWLLPLALLNLTMTAIVVVLVPEKATFANMTLPAQAIILLIAGIVIFFGAANLSKPNHPKTEIELVKNL
jgi:NADH-quinone oxidoreductase subunit H